MWYGTNALFQGVSYFKTTELAVRIEVTPEFGAAQVMSEWLDSRVAQT